MFTLCRRFLNYVRVRSAIRHADRLHQLTRKQYYVIKVQGAPRVYDRVKINQLVDMGVFSDRMRQAYYLRQYSIYYTQD